MKALLLDAQAPIETRPLRSTEVPDPQPAPGEIRVRVTACGICRTDLHVIEGDLEPELMPVVPGHQVVGVVDVCDEAAGRFKPGDRVGIAWVHSTCGVCAFCVSGRENLCAASLYTGYHRHGGYAELAVAPEAYAYALPPGLDDAQTAPLLCAGIIGYRALSRAEVPAGGSLLLVGFGSSAHVVLQIARHRGHHVHVLTRGEGHRRLAREMGAEWVGGPGDSPRDPVDSAIVFAPAGDTVPAALEAIGPGGTVALAGIHMSAIPELDYER
ncbi:MAG: zinc-binding alcohol dehydrogenase family protein, partial [Gemmatimonadota bacterium]|nr:zinc-binding alcohol dehydrogenase family protein [Gemmatimonadota bacterium]